MVKNSAALRFNLRQQLLPNRKTFCFYKRDPCGEDARGALDDHGFPLVHPACAEFARGRNSVVKNATTGETVAITIETSCPDGASCLERTRGISSSPHRGRGKLARRPAFRRHVEPYRQRANARRILLGTPFPWSTPVSQVPGLAIPPWPGDRSLSIVSSGVFRSIGKGRKIITMHGSQPIAD